MEYMWIIIWKSSIDFFFITIFEVFLSSHQISLTSFYIYLLI